MDTAPHAENLVLRAAPPPHWADPQGRADTPASKKRTNVPNVFPSKAVRLSYKKRVFIPLLLSTTYSGGPCLHVSVGHSPFVQPSQRHHGVHQPSPQDTVALSKRNPLALPIPQNSLLPSHFGGSTVYKKWGRSLLPEHSGAVHGHQGPV